MVGFLIPNILNHQVRIELGRVIRVINLGVRGFEDFSVEEDLALGVWHRHDV